MQNFFFILIIRMTNAPCQLHVLNRYCDGVSVLGTKLGILKQLHKKRFGRCLDRIHSRLGKTKVRLESVPNVANGSTKRGLVNKQFGVFLKMPDLSAGFFARMVALLGLVDERGLGALDSNRCRRVKGSSSLVSEGRKLLCSGH